MKSTVIRICLYLSSSFIMTSSHKEICEEKSQSFTFVRDELSRNLCAVANPTSIHAQNGTWMDCQLYCSLISTSGCVAFNYFPQSGVCQVYNSTPRNYIRLIGCYSYRVFYSYCIYVYNTFACNTGDTRATEWQPHCGWYAIE